MTIDEAIKYAEEIANNQEKCEKCREEHRQLTVWLKELHELRGTVAVMSLALEELQWSWEEEKGIDYVCNYYYCPACGNEQAEGHTDDCVIAKALSGRTVHAEAERIRKLEDIAEAAREFEKLYCDCDHSCGIHCYDESTGCPREKWRKALADLDEAERNVANANKKS